jgi:hypothetical protein
MLVGRIADSAMPSSEPMIVAFWSWTGWNALVSIGTLLLAAATGG